MVLSLVNNYYIGANIRFFFELYKKKPIFVVIKDT